MPRVVVIGGGFAGLAVARALARSRVELTLVDRRNHHVFQPLLYQVATASLAPSDISAPIRHVLRSQRNCEVVLAEITAIDIERRVVCVGDDEAHYDYLVVASGATHAYFGHDEWAPLAPGLKTLEDATDLRRRILLAFEAAEQEGSPDARRADLTFGIVGAGPTGVELAGDIKEIAGRTLAREYRHIDTRATRVILFEGGPRVLPAFRAKSSDRARRDLERIGVEVRLDSLVTDITPGFIHLGDERIAVRNVFWAAGVTASPLSRQLGTPLDRAGRVQVLPDLSIPGHPEVFVVGDVAAAVSADTGKVVPGVAQGAIQMGRHAGRLIAAELRDDATRTAAAREAFVYRDKGSMAVIGKARAVAQLGRHDFGGFFAWLLWSVVHVLFLIGFRNRLQVAFNWFWSWLLNARDNRLITGDARLGLKTRRRDEVDASATISSRPPP